MNLVIFTPLELEYKAVSSHVTGITDEILNNTLYSIGEFAGRHHTFRVIVQETGSKNNNLALATEKAIQLFNPEVVLLVGIAGGVKDVTAGDVVVGTKAYGYESGKEVDDDFLARPEVVHYSQLLIAHAKIIARSGDWIKRTSGPDKPANVFFGPIASGDKVIASKKGIFKRLKKHFNDTVALEMEAIGFGQAVVYHPLVHALNIRAVSDLLGDKAEAETTGSREMAAERAAAFAFELLYQLDLSSLKISPMEIKPLVQEVFNEIFPLIQKEAGQDVHFPNNAHRPVLLEKVKLLVPDAYEELKAQPDDTDQQGFLRIQLKRILEKQEGLQQELSALLEKIKIDKPSPSAGNISHSKNVIQSSSISVGGNFRLGDDIHVSGNNLRVGDEIILQVFQSKGIDEVIDHLDIQMDISESNRLKDLGRFKIQDFGKEAARSWNEHAWHLLGQALGYFTDSIGKNPKNQPAWTNLAYTYYLIGEKEAADKYLEVSKSLAGPGPNYPGRLHKSVEKAIRTGRTIHGAAINRPQRPSWFDEKHLNK